MISFIRNKDEFPLNRYAQYLESPDPVGVYAKIDRDQVVRVVSDADFEWADGADRPTGDWNQLRFEWVEFSLKRRSYPYRLGNVAIKHNEVKIKEQHAGMAMTQAMTNRTRRVVTLLETASNWGTHVDTANNLNGGAGRWDTASDQPSSPHYNAIRKTLMSAARRINLDTNGVVRPKDLVLLLAPETAEAIANSAEIHNYVKYAGGMQIIESKDNINQQWGLPTSLYGFETIVEDSPIVTSRPTASETTTTQTGTRAYIKNSGSAVLMSRKGGVNGNYGAPSFSTLQLYWLGPYECRVFEWSDPVNDRVQGAVDDFFIEIIASSETGYLLQEVLP